MFAPVAVQSRTALNEALIAASSFPTSLAYGSRRLVEHVVAIVDALAILAGAGTASLIYAQFALPGIGWQPVAQMAGTAAVIVVSGLRHCGLYAAAPTEAPQSDSMRMAGALVVGCLAALGLAFPDAPKHGHLWIWVGLWMIVGLALLIVSRHLVPGLLARLAAAGLIDLHDNPQGPDLDIEEEGPWRAYAGARPGNERIIRDFLAEPLELAFA